MFSSIQLFLTKMNKIQPVGLPEGLMDGLGVGFMVGFKVGLTRKSPKNNDIILK